MSLFHELKRRNVIRVAVAYVITAWLILQIADVVLGNIGAPAWVFSAILLILGLGFPLAMLFAWAFELTPEGLKREKHVQRSESVTHQTGTKLDRAIIAILIVAVGYFAYDKFLVDQPADASGVAAGGVARTSIAVLPFVNMSSDPEQEYFSDGISEELLNLLAQIPQFQVAGRTSSFKFKGQNDDLRLIGDSLGVMNILEGSVRKGGDRVRITAQLVKVDDGFHLWSESYDRELTDIFKVQDEIATAVVEELKITLLGAEMPTANDHSRIANTEAHNSYLQGLFYMNKIGPDNSQKAAEAFQRAVDLAPDSALAWASLADAIIRYAGQAAQGGQEALAEGRKALAKAFALNGTLPFGYVNQLILADELNEAESVLRRVLEQDPTANFSNAYMSWVLAEAGRLAEAMVYARKEPVDFVFLHDDPRFVALLEKMNLAD